MELFSQKYPESYSPLVDSRVPVLIIPGLFGSTVNWRSFAKKLGEHHPVLVVDQRNHGNSPHVDSHSYADMVADLLEFIDSYSLKQVSLCGHSMGGKVAMAFALLYPDRVHKLLVLDIAPVEYVHTHAPYLKKMIALDLDSLQSRSDADKQLAESIDDTSTRLFLLQSLIGRRGSFKWKLNLPVLLSDMPKVLSFPSSDLDGLSFTGDANFIHGQASDYVMPSHHEKIIEYFPSAQFEVIPSAGHWLHADEPLTLLEVLLNFLNFGKKND